MCAAGGGESLARLTQWGGVGQVLEVGKAVEARCCALSEEGDGVVGAPCGGVEERAVSSVEGGEAGGGGEGAGELGGGAVDGGCELGEVEYIQGAAIISLRLLLRDRNLPIKPQATLAKRPSARVQLLYNIEHAVAVPQPLIHVDKCYPQHTVVTVHGHRAAFDVREEFFSAHGEPSDK